MVRWRLTALLLLAMTLPAALATAQSASIQQRMLHPPQASASAGASAINAAAQAQAALVAQSFAREAQAVAAVQAAQAAARALAQVQQPYTPPCATPGPFCGLVPDVSNAGNWVNIAPPTAASINLGNPAHPVETLNQAAGSTNAIGTWQSFNLASNEILDINQPSSTSNLLFRINDANPSQIFGQINANGQLYLINHNGIIFGAGSQINTHALIASSLDIGQKGQTIAQRNAFFLNDGIGDLQYQGTIYKSGYQGDFSSCDAACGSNTTQGPFEGSVWVQPGAQITTNVVSSAGNPDQPGFVYVFAPYVRNGGAITSPEGEVMLAAGQNFTLDPGANLQDFTSGSLGIETAAEPGFTRATGLLNNTQNAFTHTTGGANPRWFTVGPGDAFVDPNSFGPLPLSKLPLQPPAGSIPVGTVTNNGQISTPLGTTYISAGTIQQNGVIEADTGISRNGSIVLEALRALTLGPASAVVILPDENGETTTNSAAAAPCTQSSNFCAPIINMRGQIVDLQGKGATDADGAGAIVLAPGADITVTAVQDAGALAFPPEYVTGTVPPPLSSTQILLENGSVMDVSGLQNVPLPMSDNFVTFTPRGQEFANSPLQRDGALFGQPLTVDIRDTGTRSDGFVWVGTPLADASGYVALIPRTIDYLLTNAGSITFVSGGSVVTEPGSRLAAMGGTVQYQGGWTDPTMLVAANGSIVPIAGADPLQSYSGIAGTVTTTDPKWGVSTSWTDVTMSGMRYETGYVQGMSAGAFSISGYGLTLGGAIEGGSIAGPLQRADASANPTPSGTTSATSTIITGVSSTSGIAAGQGIFGPGIPLGTTVTGVSGNFISLSQAATGSGSGVSLCVAATPGACGFAGSLAIVNQVLTSAIGQGNIVVSASDAATAFAASEASTSKSLTLSASSLSGANLSQISLLANGTMTEEPGATLAVSPGPASAITLSASGIDIEGTLRANSGTISAVARAETYSSSGTGVATPTHNDITVGSSAVIDAGGLWVNDNAASADAILGSAAINGGVVTLTTDLRSNGNADATGSIFLNSGSVIDVSSGGRILPNGQYQLDAQGRPAGNGGSLALLTEAGASAYFDPITESGDPTQTQPTKTGQDANVVLGGQILAHGFAQGGTLTLQVPEIKIGVAAETTPQNGEYDISPGFFTQYGFGNFVLIDRAGGIDFAPGQSVVLQQSNYLPATALLSLASGADGAVIADAAGVGLQSAYLRSPVNLTLTNSELDVSTLPANAAPGIVMEGYTTDANGSPVFAPSSIVADPRAAITLNAEGLAYIFGSITVPGGSITIRDTGVTPTAVLLGNGAALDVSGVALVDPRQPVKTGVVLNGGTVTVDLANPYSQLFSYPAGMLAGASINVSGAAATFDLPQNAATSAQGVTFAPTPVWSNAGTITLVAETIAWGGSLVAQPGAPEASGGTLIFGGAANAQGIYLLPSEDFPKSDNSVTMIGMTSIPTSGILYQRDWLPVPSLWDSGIANLDLLANNPAANGAHGNLVFVGDIALQANAPNDAGAAKPFASIAIDAERLVAIPEYQKLDDDTVKTLSLGIATLDAGYVQLSNSVGVNASLSGAFVPVPELDALGVSNGLVDGQLTVNGTQLIDIDNLVLSNLLTATFNSTGDIRLGVPPGTYQGSQASEIFDEPGNLGLATGPQSLVFDAAQLYPVSGVDATIKNAGLIQFGQNGPIPAAPLSAGGRLTVDAAEILQGGTLRAPLGTIALGAASAADLSPNDPIGGAFVPTQLLELMPGSLTSVSLDGLSVPFGHTTDGLSWTYSSTFNGSTPLTQPPAKQITLTAGALAADSGATIDISGGGDIYAIEFVPGLGGSRDVLAPTYSENGQTLPQYPNGRQVYAIVPGFNPVGAPINYDFLTNFGDSQPAVGSSVYLSGGSGLPAGTTRCCPRITLPCRAPSVSSCKPRATTRWRARMRP